MSIVSVRVDDESVEGPVGVMSDRELSDGDEERAIAVAEAEAWPPWDLGV